MYVCGTCKSLVSMEASMAIRMPGSRFTDDLNHNMDAGNRTYLFFNNSKC